MRVLVHIGARKSGSTYMQDLFSANAERLQEVGTYYPSPELSEGVHARGNGHPLAQALGGEADGAAVQLCRTWMLDARSLSCERVLLSAEALIGVLAESGSAARLIRIFKKAGFSEFRFLLVVRSPASALVSEYCHRIGILTTSDYDSFLKGNPPYLSEVAGFVQHSLQELEGVLEVRNYAGDSLLAVAAEFAGVALSSELVGSRSHVSLTCEEADLVHAIALTHPQYARDLRVRLQSLAVDKKASDAVKRSRWLQAAHLRVQESPDAWEDLGKITRTDFLSPPPEVLLGGTDVCLSPEQIQVLLSVLTRRQRGWRHIVRRPARAISQMSGRRRLAASSSAR